MDIGIFSTAVLAAVVANLKVAQTFFLDAFFGQEERSDRELIAIDIEVGARRIAPFVSPLVQGKVVTSAGYSTKEFAPAYIKDKRVFDPNKPMRRRIGEAIGGSLSPSDRLMMNLRAELADQVQMVTRRLEWMAAQALVGGAVTVTGESYPTVVVSFGRTAGHTITKSAGSKWGDAGIKPLDDLQSWSLDFVLKNSGASVTDVVMTPDVWLVFRNDSDVKARWQAFNQNIAGLQPDSVRKPGATLMGQIDGYRIWVYADWYIDPVTGTETPMIPTGSVILGSADIEGRRAFGAIRDEEAGYQPLPYYPKSWVEKDPSVRYLLMQSAPLVYPHRPDASLYAKVL